MAHIHSRVALGMTGGMLLTTIIYSIISSLGFETPVDLLAETIGEFKIR